MHWNRGDRQVQNSRWLLVGILLLAGVLRFAHAGAASLWFDEAFAVLTARLPLRDLLATVASDVHPPLYFVLLHFWQKALGESEFAVRCFSGLCSVLSVAGVYRLGGRLFSRRAGAFHDDVLHP